MESEQNLNSPDFGHAGMAALGTAAMVQAARSGPKWQRVLMYVFIGITVLATLAGVVDNLTSIGKLPACDAQRTRDTLSDLNKANKVNASKYNFIKEVRASETEVNCVANLALRNGGTLEYDYRIYKDGSDIKVLITEFRHP
jgi:hypothetical protein